MRQLLFAVASAVVVAGTAAAAPQAAPVLIVTNVGEGAQEIMPPPLWRKVVTGYVGGRTVRIEDGTQLPDDASCRAARASYAVFARFDRAMRLPGLAQDTDRLYAVARFTVRNCVTGTVSPTKTMRLESDPVPPAPHGDVQASAERAWDRPIRTAFAHDPLVLAAVMPASTPSPAAAASVAAAASSAPVSSVAATTPVAFRARIIRVDGDTVVLDSGRRMSVNQVLRVVADAKGNPYTAPIELVVLSISGNYAEATIVGTGKPHRGDFVEPAQR